MWPVGIPTILGAIDSPFYSANSRPVFSAVQGDCERV